MENSKGQNMDREQGMNREQGMQREGKEQRSSGTPMTDANSDHQNASANRGGTTDMDSEALRNATGTSSRGNRGSGITTKRNVTGSDYDGQVSEG